MQSLWLIPETWTSSVETKWLIEQSVWRKKSFAWEKLKKKKQKNGGETMRVDQGGGDEKKTNKQKTTGKNESFNSYKVQLFPSASYAFN